MVVTGAVGVPGNRFEREFPDQVNATRTMYARLETRVPSVGTDLGRTTVSNTVLPIGDIQATLVSWEAEIALPTSIAP